MTTILAMAVLLGVVILVHEWGHYAAARLCGIRVDVFSIGFGPRIWGWKRGNTDYRVSILPLGGYVKMAGDNPLEDREGAPDEFLSKPRWQRAIVAVAGPVMNVVLTFVAAFGMFLYWGLPYPAYFDQPVEIVALPKDAVAAKAGLQPGDHIVEINESPVSNWRDAYRALGKLEVGDVVTIQAERQGAPVAAKFQWPNRAESSSVLGYEPIPPVLEEILPGRPAALAGLKPRDVILSANGEAIASWVQFTRIVRASRDEAVDLRVRRGEEELDFSIAPVAGVDEAGRNARQIGVSARDDVAYEKVGPARAAQISASSVVAGTETIVGILGGLFQGRVSIKNLGGVIEIGRQAGIAARKGMDRFVNLMAIISLNLAILNLLPIPILDGGHLLLLAVEGTMRRDLSIALKERFLQVGMVFLLVIFAIVMYNDVLKVLPNR